jgi:RHS repeat-associated protein
MAIGKYRHEHHNRDTGATSISLSWLTSVTQARYYDPSLGRFLSVDPVLDVNKNLPEPQRWNRYSYASNNPVVRVDPDGRRDIYVVIWLPKAPYVVGNGSVGHVAAIETDGRVILSQFPDKHWISGKNTTLSYTDTIKKEGRPADVAYKVFVPDDAKVDKAAQEKRNAENWKMLPLSSNSTHCADSVAAALNAGGVPIVDPEIPATRDDDLTPGRLDSVLESLELDHKASMPWSVVRIFPLP